MLLFIYSIFSFFILVAYTHSNDADQVARLHNGSRVVLSLGLNQKDQSLFLMLADSTRETNLDNIYIFNLNKSSLSSLDDLYAPKVVLTNGSSFAEKFPSLYSALQGKTVRNWTLTITDSKVTYLLIAFDSVKDTPLLYNLQTNTQVSWSSGSFALSSFLGDQYASLMIFSSNEEMVFYSHVQYNIEDAKGGSGRRCMYAFQSHHFSGQLLSSPNTQLNRPLSAISLCKVNVGQVKVSLGSCPEGNCVDWQLQSAFADQQKLYLIGKSEVYVLENILKENDGGGSERTINVTTIPLTSFFVPLPLNDTATDAPLPIVPIVAIASVLLLCILLICLSIYFSIRYSFWSFVSSNAQKAADSGKQIEHEMYLGYNYNDFNNTQIVQNDANRQSNRNSKKRQSHNKSRQKTTSNSYSQSRPRSGKGGSSSNKKSKQNFSSKRSTKKGRTGY